MNAHKKFFCRRRNNLPKQNVIRPICHDSSYRRNRHIIDQPHYRGKDRQCKPSVRHNPVNLVGDRQLLFPGLLNTAVCHGRNVMIPFIRNDALRVIIQPLLCLCYYLRYIRGLHHLPLKLLVSFKQLYRIESFLFFCNPCQFLFNLPKISFHLQRKSMDSFGLTLILRHFHGHVNRFPDAFSL